MSKIFKRPMFRRGGEVGGGITSGLRNNFEVGGSAKERLMKVYEEYPVQSVDPLSQFLIQGGLNLMSATPRGGTLATAAEAFKEPTTQLFTGLGARDKARRDIAVSGEMLDIEGDIKKDIATIKAKQESGLQKDYSAQRQFEKFLADNIAAASELQTFQKPGIREKFPAQAAEFDVYGRRALKTDPRLEEFSKTFVDFVPWDKKSGTYDYEAMIPGYSYYHPERKIYMTYIPQSEDQEGGFYTVDPYTGNKELVQP